MSTPPKEPKPGAGPTLEQTFLGVAPAAPEPASSSAPPSSSAIIAAPMISVSGDRKERPAAAPAAAARPAALQGGWQNAGVGRPPGPDQTAMQGTPGAWPMPPAPTPAQPPVHAPARALPPRPEGARPAAPATPNPRLAAPATPGAGGGLHHTALASEYLRNAREVALGPGATPAVPRAVTPSMPSVESLPARPPQPQQHYAPQQPQQHYAPPQQPQQHYAPPQQPQQHYAPQQPQQHYAPPQHYSPPQQPREYESPAGPATQMPLSEPMSTAASRAPASGPAVTASPPATAALSEPVPLPYASPTYQPAVAYAPEPQHGPRSMGTQASVAPPLGAVTGAQIAPSPGPLAQAMLAAAPNPVRGAAPNPMAGTMMDRTPSVPGSALPPTAAPATALVHGGSSTRFEQVPSARGALGQQATGFGLHIPIDQSATDWGHTGPGQASGKAQGKPGSQLRLILLAALAVLAIGFAAFGKQLLDGATAARGARAEVDPSEQRAAAEDARGTDQATLTNLPSSGAATAAPTAPAAGIAPVAANNAAPAPAAPALDAPVPALAAAPALAAVPSVPVQAEAEEKPDPVDSKAASEAHKVAEAAATPESRLAAQAARHVLAARFAEALPLYRQLQQSFPQNTAYAAMTRVLEQKTAGSKPGAQP